MALRADPAAFVGRVQRRRRRARRRGSVAAQAALAAVGPVSDGQLIKIAEVCAAFEVDGMRADIVTARAAVGPRGLARPDGGHAGRHPGRRPAGAAAPAPPQSVRRARPGRGPARPAPRRRGAGPDRTPPEPEPPRVRSRSRPSPAERSERCAEPEPGRTGQNDTDAPRSRPQGRNDTTRPDPPTGSLRAATEHHARAGQAYRTRLFTVSGVGAGEAGRRSRAITVTGPDGRDRTRDR